MKADAPITMEPVPTFPVNYPDFHTMAEVGDTIFIGRYLVRILRLVPLLKVTDSIAAITQQQIGVWRGILHQAASAGVLRAPRPVCTGHITR